jgi:hypothetical protein
MAVKAVRSVPIVPAAGIAIRTAARAGYAHVSDEQKQKIKKQKNVHEKTDSSIGICSNTCSRL